MRLLIDMGNTRLKWQLREGGDTKLAGVGALESEDLFAGLDAVSQSIERIAVSTVASEVRRDELVRRLAQVTPASLEFYWAESLRNGLSCAYEQPRAMGADRWHALYAGWTRSRDSLLVIDAGSAITMDFVGKDGCHQGGYILPGKQMMLRSLRQDAARIHYDDAAGVALTPGDSTSRCVHHGLRWLWTALVDRIHLDIQARAIDTVLVTGGDATELLECGLSASWAPALVLDGVGLIDEESQA